MNPGDTDGFFAAFLSFYIQVSVLGNGGGKLGYLVSLGQVRIKIIFPVKPDFPGNFAVGCKRGFDGKGDGLPVEHRQYPGHTGAHRTGVGIGGFSKLGGAIAKNRCLKGAFCFFNSGGELILNPSIQGKKMKKLMVIAVLLVFFTGSAYAAAEWNFYGSARISAKVKVSDTLTGQFEYGT